MVDMNQQHISVVDMLWYHMLRVKEFVDSCLRLAIYLDAELVSALVAVEDCRLETFVEMIRQMPARVRILALVPEIFEYLLLCDRLLVLLCDTYGDVLDGVEGLSIAEMREMRAANGPLLWRSGATCPWPEFASAEGSA
jgi:hypothetical protein